MAIMVEQEGSKINWTLIIGAGIFVALVFAGAYYLFFKSPGTIEDIVVSGTQQQIVNIANTKFDYKPTLDQLSRFSNNFSSPIASTTLGRTNPFQQL
ncbi:MAG: hypothetical protein AAB920_01905 [Patescibacteria group bacterium]